MPENTVPNVDYFTSQDAMAYYKDELDQIVPLGLFQTANTLSLDGAPIERDVLNQKAILRAYGKHTWSGTNDGLEMFNGTSTFNILTKLKEDKKTIKIRQMLGVAEYIEIEAIIESVSMSASAGADATCSLTWSSNGDAVRGVLAG